LPACLSKPKIPAGRRCPRSNFILLDRLTSGETQGFLGGKDVFLLIFKKEIRVPQDLYLMINNQSILATESNVIGLKANRHISPETLACFRGMEQWQPLHIVAPEVAEFLIN
jgi:hypothetical protein